MKLEKFKEWARLEALPKIQAHPVPLAVGTAGGVVAVLLWGGGYIITTGLLAGLMLSLGLGVIIWKLRSSDNRVIKWLYQKIIEHPLASDIGLTGLAFCIAPNGLASWVAATIVGLLGSIWLLSEHASIEKNLLVVEAA